MNKKFLVSVLIISLLVLTLQGCSNTNVNESMETITLLMNKDISPAGIEAVAKLAEEKLNIKVDIELQALDGDSASIIANRFSTGTMTDFVVHNSGCLFLPLNPEENLLDLSGEPFINRLDDSFKTTVSSKDKVYGVPVGSSQGAAWLYNKKIYEDLNLKVPETWDELIYNCEKIKEAGKTAVVGTYKDAWTAQPVFLMDAYSLFQAEPNFPEDFTNNKVKFAETEAGIRSFEKLSEIKSFLNEDYMSANFERGVEMLAQGEAAHWPILTRALSNIYNNYPDKIDDIGIFAQPDDEADKTGLTVYMPSAFYVNKNSEKADAVLKWLEFYISDEGLEAYASALKPDGPFVVKGYELPEDSYPGVLEMQKYFDNNKAVPALEYLSEVKGANSPEISIECVTGMITPLEAAKEYDRDCEKSAKQLGLKGW